eukprot:1554741-Prymnesium_polylepis.1
MVNLSTPSSKLVEGVSFSTGHQPDLSSQPSSAPSRGWHCPVKMPNRLFDVAPAGHLGSLDEALQ